MTQTYYMETIKTHFQIGGFRFAILHPADLPFPENFMLFRTEENNAPYSYTIRITDDLPAPRGKLAARRDDVLVYVKNGQEMRYLSFHYGMAEGFKPGTVNETGIPGHGPYACTREESSEAASVFVRPWVLEDLKVDPVFSSLLCLEKHLLCDQGIILHCAYMVNDGKAICFTAPSGTGKSTQAQLWQEYRGTRQVNGDRALLQKVNGTWMARGWPVCGTSKICFNEDTPLQCLVLLSQGPENMIEEMSSAQRFTGIYPQITVNRWNRASQIETMRLVDDLLTSVPVYHLTCTISEEAVVCLEKKIESIGE